MNPLFNLTASKTTTEYLRNLVLYEEVDLDRLKAIKLGDGLLDRWEDDDDDSNQKTTQHDNELQQLTRYQANYKAGLGVEVKYLMGGRLHTDYGRTYPKKSLGLTCLRTKIRNTLSHDVYYDFDMANAQPTIMCILAEHHGMSNTYLKDYCNNREDIIAHHMTHYGVDRQDIKKLFIQTLFCGGFKSWASQVGLPLSAEPTDFLEQFKREISTICKTVNDNNKHIGGIYTLVKRERKPNVEASAFAIFNQHLETSIMAKVMEHLMTNTVLMNHRKRNYFSGTYEFDGLRLPIKTVDTFKYDGKIGVQAVVAYLTTLTLEETGYAIQWTQKTSDAFIEYTVGSQDDTSEYEDWLTRLDVMGHQGCYDLIAEDYGEFITYDIAEKRFYCWNDTTDRYETNDFPIRDKIKSVAIRKVQDVCDKLQLIDDVDKSLFAKVDTILRRYHSAGFKDDVVKIAKSESRMSMFDRDTKRFLLGFNNGVLDMENRSFRKHLPSDKVTMTCGYDFDVGYLPKDYEFTAVAIESPDVVQQKRKRIMDLLKTIQPLEAELQYFLKIHATALTGVAIEKLFMLNGSGRNGKGLMSSMMTESLGDYACASLRHELITDTSKANANGATEGLTPLAYKRYIVMKEPPKGAKMSNAKIKLITGGDDIAYRPLYGKETHMTAYWTAFFETNGGTSLTETPTTAEFERFRDVYFANKFVSADKVDEANGYYACDATLKDKEFLHGHRLALVSLLLDYLPDLFHNGFNVDLNMPPAVRSRTDAYLRESNAVLIIVRQMFDIDLNTKEPLKHKQIINTVMASKPYSLLTRFEKKEINSKTIRALLESDDYFKTARVDDKKNHIIRFKLVKKNEYESSEEEDDDS